MKDGSGYPLPAVINPPDTICVQIEIPNEEGHRQAFLGAMYTLTRWYSWERDSAHTAREVAAVWAGIFETLRETMYSGMCEMIEDIRVADCGLEKLVDGEWADIPNSQFVPLDGTCAMTGGLEIIPGTSEVPLTITKNTLHTTDFVQFKKTDGVIRNYINQNGFLFINEPNVSGTAVNVKGTSYFYAGNPGQRGVIVDGHPSQTADLQQWRNITGADVRAAISAAGAASFRNQMLLRGLPATGAAVDMARLYTVFNSNVFSTYTAKVVLAASYYGGEQPGLAIEGSPSGVKLKFYDALSPVVKQTVTGERQANAALASLIDALVAVGLINDATTLGEAPYTQVEADAETCRVAFGLGERLVTIHLLEYFIWLTTNAASLDYLDPATYDPLMDAYGLEYTDYTAARAWSIDWTFNWTDYGTYATFDDLVDSMLPFLSDNMESIQCAFLQNMDGSYLSPDAINEVVARLENLALGDSRWLLVAGLIEYTSSASWAELVNAANAYGQPANCAVCGPYVPIEFATLSASIGSLDKSIVIVGDIFTFTAAFIGTDFYNGQFSSDRTIQIQVISVTNYTGGYCQFFDVPGGWSAHTDPATILNMIRTIGGFGANASTQYVIEFEVLSLP